MKVFILTDGCNWIVDRITDIIIKGIRSIEFVRADYTKITTDELVTMSNNCDLVHYNNWDISYHLGRYKEIKTPFLYTVRSFRYPPYTYDVARWATRTLVIHPDLKPCFPRTTYISDGIMPEIEKEAENNKPFIVGYAGLANSYKGYDLIAEACMIAGVTFRPATGNIKPADMPAYYRSLSLYLCASEAEGFSTPVMECARLNVPVATVSVGIPKLHNFHFIKERKVMAIVEMIQRFNTASQVKDLYNWSNILPQIKNLYDECTR